MRIFVAGLCLCVVVWSFIRILVVVIVVSLAG